MLLTVFIENGLIKGYARLSGSGAAKVSIDINGQWHVSILTTTAVSQPDQEAFKLAADKNYGSFIFPLPQYLFDGAPHQIQATLETSDNINPPKACCFFQNGDRHGYVASAEECFQGWVAFCHRPKPLPELAVHDANGVLCKTVTLIPLPSEDGLPDKFVARFRLPKKEFPGGVRFYCGSVELKGSPCQLADKRIGLLEDFDSEMIHGWAFDINQPTAPIELALKIDGILVQRFRPNVRRPDIAKHLNLPEDKLGIVGFQLRPPEILLDGEPHQISVEFADLNHPLRGSNQRVHIPKTWVAFKGPELRREKVRRQSLLPRPAKPSVSVIILNRDGEAPLTAFLESWEKHNTQADVELIVVDHASADNSLDLLQNWQNRLPIHVIPLQSNDSFSASCNRAATIARGEYLLFMNNDIVWLQDALPAMIETLKKDPQAGAVGLKLLKAADDGRSLEQPQVQHLGVRFKLSGPAYWPYETTQGQSEAEYSAQTVPVVTAAVMLCRKDDFAEAGLFDTTYFYGFEDVELCLRLSQRLNKKIVCRNDLVALHRHGHTRLSGRANDIFERLVSNADVLQQHVGLWLKRQYWASLLSADRHFTVDALTIGIVTDEADVPTPLQVSASQLAQQLQDGYPEARIVFLPPSRGWYNVRNIHLLVVGHPEYDIRHTTQRREDLLILAWIRNQPEIWASMPWWTQFDAYVASNASLKKQLAPTISNPISRISSAAPLGPILDSQAPPLRIALLVSPLVTAQYQTLIATLEHSLKAAGAVVWQEPPEESPGPFRVADIRIDIRLDNDLPDQQLDASPNTLNILWLPTLKASNNQKQPAGWLLTHDMPQADWLQQQLEQALGNTFRTS